MEGPIKLEADCIRYKYFEDRARKERAMEASFERSKIALEQGGVPKAGRVNPIRRKERRENEYEKVDGETEDELETSFHKFVRFQEFEKRRSTPKKKINQTLNQSETEHYTDISDYASETGKVTKGRGRGKSPAGAARPWDL